MTTTRALKLTLGALLLSLFVGTCEADPIISIQPASASVSAGDVFTLDIDISNITDLFAYQFDLGFAPGVLSALSITEGALLPGGGTSFFIPGVIDNSAGVISFTADSLIGAISGVDGTGILAQVQFKALASGTSSIDLSNVFLLDSNLNTINFSTSSGSVAVQGPSAVPEPSSLVLLASGLCCFLLARRHLNQSSAVPSSRS